MNIKNDIRLQKIENTNKIMVPTYFFNKLLKRL